MHSSDAKIPDVCKKTQYFLMQGLEQKIPITTSFNLPIFLGGLPDITILDARYKDKWNI